MKHYIISTLLLVALVACQDKDDPKPAENPDPFLGTWHYSNTNLNIEASFKALKNTGGGDQEYLFQNITISCPKADGQTNLVYGVDVYDEFVDNGGFGLIKIHGGNDTFWMFLNLDHNSIQQDGGTYIIKVRELQILTSKDANPTIIQDQTLQRVPG